MSLPAPNVEKLKFRIGLTGTFWDQQPKFTVWVDETKLAEGVASAEIQYIEFFIEVDNDLKHELKVRLENKTDRDTVTDNDIIVKDMLLNIESVEIDGIDIGHLKWVASKFYPDDTATRPVLDGCVNLGWNGAYTIEFTCPYYLWLLENL